MYPGGVMSQGPRVSGGRGERRLCGLEGKRSGHRGHRTGGAPETGGGLKLSFAPKKTLVSSTLSKRVGFPPEQSWRSPQSAWTPRGKDSAWQTGPASPAGHKFRVVTCASDRVGVNQGPTTPSLGLIICWNAHGTQESTLLTGILVCYK